MFNARTGMEMATRPTPVVLAAQIGLGTYHPVLGDPVLSCIHLWHEGLCRSRVVGPDGNPLGIAAAEHLRVGQVGGESVTFGLTRHY